MNRETSAVRAGEDLDVSRVRDHLAAAGIGDLDSALSVEQFRGGSSNLTYLVKVDGEEYVLRRPPFGNTVRSAHDMKREFRVLAKLAKVYPPAPKVLLFCDDISVIGSEFYLMERRRGVILRAEVPAEIASSPRLQRAVCESLMQNLARLHSLDIEAAGLADLGDPDGYCRRQVEGWTRRYFAAKTHDWPELESAIEWLNANIPAESGAALIHNDHKFDNVMLDPADLTRVVAVLDWEMATVGDPLMDLGTTLGYWIGREGGEEMLNMPFNPRVLRETISRAELVEMYSAAAGRDVGDMLFYYVFGLFKIAVIAQQIYARYARGFTTDARFARFDHFVSGLGRLAAVSIENGSIE
ncbi:MAG: phosphotransferase family protein [Pyrinomonadaceae bacterium]